MLPVTVDKTVKRLAVLSLVGQIVLVVTGGGCPPDVLGPGLPHVAPLHRRVPRDDAGNGLSRGH